MLRIAAMCCIVLSTATAQAYELGDNPAFCAGFLASHSDRYAAMMRTHENKLIHAFNRFGPKDSTDGRGFTEWLHVGARTAEDNSDPKYNATFLRCRDLIESIAAD